MSHWAGHRPYDAMDPREGEQEPDTYKCPCCGQVCDVRIPHKEMNCACNRGECPTCCRD